LPIYEYACTSCGEHFDLMQRVNDPPATECALCKGKVRKVLSTPALQFKGSGWYITDYAGKNAANGSSKEGQPAAAASESAAPAPAKTEAPACACSSAGCGNKDK